MATYNSGAMSTDNQYIKYRIQAITNSNNVVDSTTNVTFKVQVWRTNTGYTTTGNGTAYLQVNGTTYTASITTSKKFTYNSYTTVLTKTVNVPRGAAGDASTVARARISHDRFTSSYQQNTFKFPTINRYALLDNVVNFNDEENPTVSFINPAGIELVTDLKVRLTWNEGADSTAYVDVPQEDWGGGSITLDLSAYRSALRSAAAGSNTLAVQFDLMSTLGGTQYHSIKAATMEVINADPIPGAVSYQDINAATVAITGSDQVIVQLHSTLRIHTAAATAQKGASITEYKLTINGNDYTPDGSGNVDFINPNVAGTYAAVITVTDSRGNTATASVNITITSWAQPTADFNLQRENNFITGNTTLNVNGQISTVPGSTIEITERHKDKSGGSWSAPSVVPNSTDTTLVLDYQKEWEVEITVSDSFTRADGTSTVFTATVGKGIPVVYFDTLRRSFAVNGLPDDDEQLYVGGSIKATGNIQGNKIIANEMSTTNDDATFSKTSGSWTFGSGEYTRCGNVVQLRLAFKGGGSNVSVGSNSIAGTVNGIPLPSHTVRIQGYYSGTVLMGELTSSGGFNVRILGSALNLSTANTATLSGTYIVES